MRKEVLTSLCDEYKNQQSYDWFLKSTREEKKKAKKNDLLWKM